MEYNVKRYKLIGNSEKIISISSINTTQGFDQFTENICHTESGQAIEGLAVESILIDNQKAFINVEHIHNWNTDVLREDSDEINDLEFIGDSTYNEYVIINNPSLEDYEELTQILKGVDNTQSFLTKYEVNNGASDFFLSIFIGVISNAVYDLIKNHFKTKDVFKVNVENIKNVIAQNMNLPLHEIILVSAINNGNSWDYHFRSKRRKIHVRTDLNQNISIIK